MNKKTYALTASLIKSTQEQMPQAFVYIWNSTWEPCIKCVKRSVMLSILTYLLDSVDNINQ